MGSEPDAAPKLCLYCLRPFTGRGRCCSTWCARKVNGKTAWVTRSRSIARARLMARLQKAARHVPKFRRLAMGDLDPNEAALQIFGTAPCETEPRHGDTLDVS